MSEVPRTRFSAILNDVYNLTEIQKSKTAYVRDCIVKGEVREVKVQHDDRIQVVLSLYTVYGIHECCFCYFDANYEYDFASINKSDIVVIEGVFELNPKFYNVNKCCSIKLANQGGITRVK